MRNLILLLLITIASTAYAGPLQTGLIDDTNPVLDYTGTWSDGSYVDAYGGGYQTTSDVSASLLFETYATGFTLFFIYDALGDDVEVCVELDCTTVSTMGMVDVGKIELTALASGLKSVTVSKVTADTSVFLFDALYVHPEASAISEVTEQQIEFDLEGQTFTGLLDLRITSGDAIQVMLLMAIFVLMVFRFILELWK